MDEGGAEGLDRLSALNLARAAEVDLSVVEELSAAGVLQPDASGDHASSDIHRVRLWTLLHDAGVTMEQFLAGIAAGIIVLEAAEFFVAAGSVTSQTQAALAAELGVEPQLLGRLQMALGLPSRAMDTPIPVDEEGFLRQMVAIAKYADQPEMAIRGARLIGDSTQRLAYGFVSLIHEYILQPTVAAGQPVFRTRADAERTRPYFEAVFKTAFAVAQRHGWSAAFANWATSLEALLAMNGLLSAEPHHVPGIAFVDLSGFTRHTEERGDVEGTRLAAGLVDEAERAAATSGARIVKLLGDGVLLHSRHAGDVLDTALTLVESLPAAGLPPAHAGVNAGPVIERDGDVFGRTVNLASRIAGQARAGEILVSATMVAEIGDGITLTELPPVQLKGVVDPFPLWRAERD
jgi:class 3 adenylate cyclase